LIIAEYVIFAALIRSMVANGGELVANWWRTGGELPTARMKSTTPGTPVTPARRSCAPAKLIRAGGGRVLVAAGMVLVAAGDGPAVAAREGRRP